MICPNCGHDNYHSRWDGCGHVMPNGDLCDCMWTREQILEAQFRVLSDHLSTLLAIIHRDGGHYEAENGTDKAVKDAIDKVVVCLHNLPCKCE